MTKNNVCMAISKVTSKLGYIVEDTSDFVAIPRRGEGIRVGRNTGTCKYVGAGVCIIALYK